MMCGYKKDTAKFKLYTKEEKEKLLEEQQIKAQERKDRRGSKVICTCWKRNETYCQKHEHPVEIRSDGKCHNCEKKDGKRKEVNSNEGVEKRQKGPEEKPILRKYYYHDDLVVDRPHENHIYWMVRNQVTAELNYNLANDYMIQVLRKEEEVNRLQEEALEVDGYILQIQQKEEEIRKLQSDLLATQTEVAEYQELFKKFNEQTANNLEKPILKWESPSESDEFSKLVDELLNIN